MFASGQKDAEGEFLRNHDAMVRTSSGAVRIITAEGDLLGRGLGQRGLEKALAAWDALPEKERRPGAVKIPELKERDPRIAKMRPPENALILRVDNRRLARSDEGELRYLLDVDFSTKYTRRVADRYREPSNDFMWVLEDEWEALLPESPQVGARIAVPESLALRLLRFHLNPLLSVRGAMCFTRTPVGDGELFAVVEEVGPRVRLRLEGSARLTHSIDEGKDLVYEPAFLGYVEYDRSTRRIDRFDMVAFGDLEGNLPALGGTPMKGFPEGPRPFGVAFELVADPKPAETIRPHGCGKRREAYLHPAAE